MLNGLTKIRMAGFVLVVVLALYNAGTIGIIPTLIKLSPFAQELERLMPDTVNKREDALRIGNYLRAIADLLRRDRQRDNRLVHSSDAKDVVNRVGNIVIDNFSLPDKYPDLLGRLANDLDGVREGEVPDRLERFGSALCEIGGQD